MQKIENEIYEWFFGLTYHDLRRYFTDIICVCVCVFFYRYSRYLQERKLGTRLHTKNVLHVDVGKDYEIASPLYSQSHCTKCIRRNSKLF